MGGEAAIPVSTTPPVVAVVVEGYKGGEAQARDVLVSATSPVVAVVGEGWAGAETETRNEDALELRCMRFIGRSTVRRPLSLVELARHVGRIHCAFLLIVST